MSNTKTPNGPESASSEPIMSDAAQEESPTILDVPKAITECQLVLIQKMYVLKLNFGLLCILSL